MVLNDQDDPSIVFDRFLWYWHHCKGSGYATDLCNIGDLPPTLSSDRIHPHNHGRPWIVSIHSLSHDRSMNRKCRFPSHWGTELDLIYIGRCGLFLSSLCNLFLVILNDQQEQYLLYHTSNHNPPNVLAHSYSFPPSPTGTRFGMILMFSLGVVLTMIAKIEPPMMISWRIIFRHDHVDDVRIPSDV